MTLSSDGKLISKSKIKSNQFGFTLIELLITISIVAIIASLATPSMARSIANQRVKTNAGILQSALKEAKAESLIKRASVRVVYDDTKKTLKLYALSIPKKGKSYSSDSVSDDKMISSFNLDSKTSIKVIKRVSGKPSSKNIEFQPDKHISENMRVVFTVCDSGADNENPIQIILTGIGNINMNVGKGSC